MHSLGAMHRDIKLENILMTDNSENAQPILADLGLSVVLGSQQGVQEIYGTSNYMAPEVFLGQPYSHEADLWSFGALFYALVSGYMPIKEKDMQKVFEQERKLFVNF